MVTQRDTVYSMLRRAHKDGVTNGAFTEAGILRYSALLSAPTAASASGDRPVSRDVGLPRPEYQAGADAAVEADAGTLFSVAYQPTSHYREEAA